jgi:hypothetical protein
LLETLLGPNEAKISVRNNVSIKSSIVGRGRFFSVLAKLAVILEISDYPWVPAKSKALEICTPILY